MNQDNKIEEKNSSSELSKKEQDVLKDLESEGVEISTDVTKVLESLTDEQRKVIVGALYAVEESSSFRGPLPPPEMLKGYESILPGASERILSMAEKQQEHRMHIEKTSVDRQTKQSGNGQIWGGVLAVLFGIITFILGYTGHDVLAGTIGTTTIISLVIVFVLHKVPEGDKKKKDVEEES